MFDDIRQHRQSGCTAARPLHGTADAALRTHHLHSPAPSVRMQRADVPSAVDALVSSMLAKDPQARPSAEAVYQALLPLTSVPDLSLGGDESRDPTRPFRRPLLAAARRRDRDAGRTRLTDDEAELRQANVKALLDNDRPSEAIRLLEDGVERAGHDAFQQLRLRHFLAAALFYAGEYTRAASLFDVVGRDYGRYLPPTDSYVLDCSYYAGHAYAEIGKPDKALPHLRFHVQNADASAGEDDADKVLESRFVIAQMLAADGYPDEALAELEAIRPLLADAFGADSTQVRNLNKQISRLGPAGEHDSFPGQ